MPRLTAIGAVGPALAFRERSLRATNRSDRAYSASVLANETGGLSMIDGISAVTLGTHEMPRAVRFYRALGFEILHGGEESSFTSFRAGATGSSESDIVRLRRFEGGRHP